jgi:hypothetical protein
MFGALWKFLSDPEYFGPIAKRIWQVLAVGLAALATWAAEGNAADVVASMTGESAMDYGWVSKLAYPVTMMLAAWRGRSNGGKK